MYIDASICESVIFAILYGLYMYILSKVSNNYSEMTFTTIMPKITGPKIILYYLSHGTKGLTFCPSSQAHGEDSHGAEHRVAWQSHGRPQPKKGGFAR